MDPMERLHIPDIPSITSPVPSYHSHISENEGIPLWAREVAASRQHGQSASRASSVISTRTKISTNSAQEDARSIDLNIDGVCFRINRDGSRISTNTDFQGILPRYIPIWEAEAVYADRAENGYVQNSRNDASITRVTTDTAGLECEPHRHLLSTTLPNSAHLNSAGDASNSQYQNSGASSVTAIGLGRNPSFTPGKDTISVIKRRAVSQNDIPKSYAISRKPVDAATPLRRRNGVRLPTLITDLKNDQQSPDSQGRYLTVNSASPRYKYPRSANPTLGNDNHSYSQYPRSPMFIGRDARGIFPSPTPMLHYSPLPSSLPDDQKTVGAHSPATFEEGYADTYPPPPMESENDISVHYTRLVRTIDRDHRKALHERDKDMAKLRERLNEQDTIYRQQLRGQDFIIDDLKSRLAHLESTTEAKVENACNTIEDIWESRWKDRDFHLMERMHRIEMDAQAAVQRAVAERDKVWAKGWATKYKQLIGQLEEVGHLSQSDMELFDANTPVI
jgi:hypothetical protein